MFLVITIIHLPSSVVHPFLPNFPHVNNYIKGYPYEIFIRVAFTCQRGDEHGASAHFMQQLLDAETQRTPEAPQLLEQLRGNIQAALEEFLKQDLSDDEKLDLMAMKHKVDVAKTGNELCDVVGEALLITGKLLR